MDRLDDAVGLRRHDRKQRVVADVGHLLGASIARPRPPDPSEEERLLVGSLEPAPHHGALRSDLVRLEEGCRQNDATMPAVQPVAPQAILQGPQLPLPSSGRCLFPGCHTAIFASTASHQRWLRTLYLPEQGLSEEEL